MAADQELAARFDPVVAAAMQEATRHAPYPGLLGLSVDEFAPGRVVCSLPIRPEIDSGIGVVHGGAIASLVDHALSLSIYPLVEKGKWVATAEFKLNYVRAARQGQGQRLRASAQVLSLRRTVGVARVDVTLDDGELVAVAQGTLYVRDL